MLVSEYSDFLEIIINNDGEEEIIDRISRNSISSISNKDGIIIIGDVARKQIDNYQVLTKIINLNELKNIKDITSLEGNKDFKIYNTIKVNDCKTGCGGTTDKFEIYKNLSGCKRDRKVKLQFTTGIDQYDFSTWGPFSGYRVWGLKRIAYTCIWVHYNTTLKLTNMSYTVNYPSNYNTSTGQWTRSDYTKTVSSKTKYGREISDETYRVKLYVNATPSDTYFKKYKGTFTSTGVGTDIKTSKCGY